MDGSSFALGTEVVEDGGLPLTWESKPRQSAGKLFPFNDLMTCQKFHKILSIILLSRPSFKFFVGTFLEIIQPVKMSSLQM